MWDKILVEADGSDHQCAGLVKFDVGRHAGGFEFNFSSDRQDYIADSRRHGWKQIVAQGTSAQSPAGKDLLT